MKRAAAYAVLLLLAAALAAPVASYADGRGRLGYKSHHPAARYHQKYPHARKHRYFYRTHRNYYYHRPHRRHGFYGYRHRYHFYPWPTFVYAPPLWYSPHYYTALPYMSFNFSYFGH